MRLPAMGMMAVTLAVLASACAPVFHPIDPEDAADRAVVGAALGAGLGTGLGATFSINPAIGTIIGAETGATLGAAAGVMTAARIPSYQPIAVPTATVIPHFYDSWPPGYHAPPNNPETQAPPAG